MMISFGFNVNSTSVLCYSNMETNQHIFDDCPFSYTVLKSSPVPLTLSWSEWQAGSFTRDRESCLKIHLAWLYIPVVICNICHERNTKLHRNGCACNVDKMIMEVKGIFREKLATINAFKKQVSRDPNLASYLF